jgi:signal transduction histidine kinase
MDEWTRPAPTERQQLWDAGTGLLLAVSMLFSLVLSHSAGISYSDQAGPGTAEEIAWALAVSLPLMARRRYPVAVLIVVSIAFMGLQARFVPESFASSICLFVALYTAGAWGRDRRITDAARTLVVIAMFAWLAYSLSTIAYHDDSESHGGPLPEATANAIYLTVINLVYFGASWVFGSQSWIRARQQAELDERTEQLRRERDERARQAVMEERVRIARELHDVVAHHVSVMGVQAGAARRVLDRDPELARATLTTVEQAGRTAVGEMRRLLGVLRESGGDGAELPHQPAPGVEALDELVRNTGNQALTTEFTVVGETRNLPRSVSVSCYRIVQEALTNTVRHAGASRVDVRVRYLPDDVEVEVVDDGRGRSVTTAGTGLGHVGMRERVGLHGGALDVGRRPEGGYRVRARMPAPAGAEK